MDGWLQLQKEENRTLPLNRNHLQEWLGEEVDQ